MTYRDAWRGVDLRLYGQGRDLEHVFVVKPGGDPNAIRMDLSGIKGLKVADDRISRDRHVLRRTK